MSKRKGLSEKQSAVMDDLFDGRFDEEAVLKKHRVSRNIYKKWLRDERFCAEFDRRIAWLNRQSEALIAKYASLAAAKLVQLTDSEKDETARKACLDIISLPKGAGRRKQKAAKQEPAKAKAATELSDETASRLLAALAEEEGQKR